MNGTTQTKLDDVEEKLKAIWIDVLQLNDVGIQDNFFEVGGHSLKALELEVRIGVEFDIEISLENIFSYLTIKELAEYIRTSQENKFALIKPVPDRPFYPVSWIQKKMYLAYFDGLENAVLDFRKVAYEIDPYVLERAFQYIIKRHKLLRTTVGIKDDAIVQFVHDESESDTFRLFYWEAPGEKELQEEFIQKCVAEINQPYTLDQLPLFRVGLVRLPGEGSLLILHFHHIIFDAFSLKLVYHELDCISQGRLLPQLHLQYADYCVWQTELEHTEAYEEKKAFWLDMFADDLPVLNLPLDRPRSNGLIATYGNKNFFLDESTAKAIQNVAKQYQATPSIFLTAIYGLLLSKYTAQSDITMGILSSRRYSGLENSIGVFIRTVPIRFQITSEQTLPEYLQQVKKIWISALEHQECDIDEMEEIICRQHLLSKTDHPLYRVSMNIHTEMDSVTESIIGGEGDTLQSGNRQDIACGVYFLDSGRICLNMEYNMELFDPSTMQRMGEHFIGLLQAILSEPERRIGEFSLLTEDEKDKILHHFNRKISDFSTEQTLQSIFEHKVQTYADNIAVVCADQSLTYRELNRKTNQLARVLVERGVGPGVTVGVMLERSVDMMVALLAILKAGGAYLPISPDYPHDRVQFMLEDSQAKVVLVNQDTLESSYPKEKMYVNVQNPALYVGDDSNLVPRSSPTDLAYIMYTSGSTGNPKGVMIEHRSVINRLDWMHKQFLITEDDCFLQKTPFTFDVSVWELFGWYFQGASVCFLEPGKEKDPEAILATIARERITLLHFVPSMLSSFLSYVEPRIERESERLSSLRFMFASGEALLPSAVNTFNRIIHERSGTRLINLYGPTETTVEVSWFDCSEGYGTQPPRTIIPIGKPIDNIRLYIVDKEDTLQPMGIPGELMISGVGVGRGYLNQPEITAQKFINDPWYPGNRMYRSGDLVRWMPDGAIEYLGRKDEQVKIRGVRIELGEIENVLLELPEIEAAVAAISISQAEEKLLCLYYVSSDMLDSEVLKSYLTSRLPRFMVPDAIMAIEEIPLNSSGKVNRKRLPAPVVEVDQATDGLPTSDVEIKLTNICQKVLRIDQLGIRTNLFSVGANSLKIILIASQIRQEMNVDIPVSHVYTHPTIAEIASYIQLESLPASANGDHGLVLINKRSTEAPNLFLIHDIRVSIDAYFDLVNHLGDRFTCYGIPAEMSNGESSQDVTIEVLAKKYLEKMKKIQNDGPYFLAGWSLGGLLAFEITRQLEAAGDEVEMLVLIDSSSPLLHQHLQIPDASVVDSFRQQITQVLSAPELNSQMENESTLYGLYKKTAQYMEAHNLTFEALEILMPKEILQVIPAYAQSSQVDFYRYLNLFIDFQNAYVHYHPQRKVFAQAHLIKAKESSIEEKQWNAFFYSPVNLHEMEGDHFSIFRDPGVKEMASFFESIAPKKG
ncbi:non-ribosomal peptide synthetase [Brevibacillus sp. MS2.2]|uniref:non-ribosomal peptide synthetase n=1 Tax=Brevibacillus sp. MS2.2 TaxID=2738981 RepID=UPI00156BC878|nr:non-ribosomal peptide synthetase [Brevibacillus sp. MS2.2]NRR24830.1 amino acid adenylation domain-containing protein [Brevibacillus sp. MS2.2]